MNIPQVNMGNFNYELPEERIRKAPLAVRSDSRLVLQNEQGTYFHVPFSRFSDYLSANDLLIGNASKVVPARLFFKKVSGATIEVLCLSPYNLPYAEAFSKFKTVQFLAYVGNSKKWKDGPIVCTTDFDSNSKLILEAKRIGQVKDSFIIEFTWNVDIPFSEVLECCGRVPIPPYFARLDEALDKERYQTVYAKWEGSVAAPTAGLHYDHVVMKKLVEKNIFFKYLTLHVGAGTFKPVVSDEISGHEMHSESFEISEDLLHDILNSKGRIIAAGTTSLRALESIYWLAIQIKAGDYSLFIPQWFPYQPHDLITRIEAVSILLSFLELNHKEVISARTEICIVPGYKFKICTSLQTNFHQPKSTLLLLIAAIMGNSWRNLYEFALSEKLDFLSYGDTMFLEVK